MKDKHQSPFFFLLNRQILQNFCKFSFQNSLQTGIPTGDSQRILTKGKKSLSCSLFSFKPVQSLITREPHCLFHRCSAPFAAPLPQQHHLVNAHKHYTKRIRYFGQPRKVYSRLPSSQAAHHLSLLLQGKCGTVF